MQRAYPTEVRRLPEREALRITWSDQHVSEVGYRILRGYCPCAVCQGHAAPDVRFHEPPTAVSLEGIEPVGRYGLSFVWSDGHSTGIYRFDCLRALCPCPDCRRPGGAATPSHPLPQEDHR